MVGHPLLFIASLFFGIALGGTLLAAIHDAIENRLTGSHEARPRPAQALRERRRGRLPTRRRLHSRSPLPR